MNEHSYKGNVIEENLSNAIGLSIESMDKLLLAKNNDGEKMEISVFNNKTYKELYIKLTSVQHKFDYCLFM